MSPLGSFYPSATFICATQFLAVYRNPAMVSQRSKTLVLIHLLGTLGMSSAGDVFAVTSETQCAEDLPFGPCSAPIDKDSSAFVCTNFKDVLHEAFTQDFYVNDQLQFTVDWEFQSGPKTLQERFENAVTSGEEVIWTVNTALGKSFNGTTPERIKGAWRFSRSSNVQSSFAQLSGTGFSEDDGSWGAAFTNGVTQLDGNGYWYHGGSLSGGWGHENKNGRDSSMCKRWYANGIFHSVSGTETIHNVMALGRTSYSDYKGRCFFHGATLLTLEDQTTKAMTELQVGDKIQTSDANGELGFSPVITVQQKPGERVKFLKLTTETGKSVSITRGHYLYLCNATTFSEFPPFKRASDLNVGDCLLTVDGNETLTEIISGTDFGVYSAVTEDGYIVADGITMRTFCLQDYCGPNIIPGCVRGPRRQNTISENALNFLEKLNKSGLRIF